MSQEKIHNLLLSRLSTFPTHRAYANHLDCDEAELSRIVNGKQLISHRILVDLLTHVLEEKSNQPPLNMETNT
jgi:plasmid maintenance system antidote protein VapI